MLTEAEKTDTRRFCGYPALGSQAVLPTTLEHRLNTLSATETAVLRDYLATLRSLEKSIPAVADSLDTAQVSVWTRNPNELRDRTRLFDSWRRRLAEFLGIPTGPHLPQGGVTFVV